ncbi:MAG: transporter substrate-binding domain-containing protein [Kordiimonadaceae bacterium]|nr:transporter substrate-binding domain-containing protein [Kordiimonadaceae bacterium]
MYWWIGHKFQRAVRVGIAGFATVFAFWGGSGAAAQTAAAGQIWEPVRVATYHFPPKSYLDDGAVKGSNIVLQRALFEEAGLKYEFRFFTTSRIYNELKSKQSLVHAWISIDIARVRPLAMPVKPSIFGPLRLGLIGLAGNKPPAFADLKAQNLIIILGFTYGGYFNKLKSGWPDMNLVTAPNRKSAFRMLKAGRARYLFNYYAETAPIAVSQGVVNMEVTPVYEWLNYLFVSRNAPNAALLHARLEAAAKRIAARNHAAVKK